MQVSGYIQDSRYINHWEQQTDHSEKNVTDEQLV